MSSRVKSEIPGSGKCHGLSSKVSDSCVAVVAQQSSDLAGVVAVIDGELVLPVVGLIVAWGLPAHAAHLRLLTRGAEEASAAEQAANPRSTSVRLRAAERIRPTKGSRP